MNAVAVAVAVAVASALVAVTANAQFQATASPDADVRQLGSINVKGTPIDDYQAKESEVGVLGPLPLLSTPFAINVITHDLLLDQQAAYLGDFLKNDPSASIGNVVVSFANLRGFSIGSAGFLFDGLGIGALLSDGRVAMPPIDHIEILKGASTFLYGIGASSSLGGAINYIPKEPVEAPVREVAFTYNSTTQFGVQIDLGDRFGADHQFGYRLNTGLRDGDTAVDDNTWRQGSLSLALDWRIDRDLTLEAGIHYADNTFDGIQPFFVGASNADGSPVTPIPRAPDAKHNIGPSFNTFDQNATIGTLRADWSIARDWSVTAQYAKGRDNRPYDGSKDTRFGVITSAAGDIALFASEEANRIDAQAGQVLLHGRVDSGPLRHDLTLGVSGSEDKNHGNFQTVAVLPGNLYTPNPAPEPATVDLEALPYTGKTTTSGVLISDIVSYQQWSVLLGGRQAKVTAFNADGSKPGGGSVSRFSPTAALMYKPTPNSLLYANYAQGLEPGGTAPDTTANAGDVMAPLVTKQYELGAKLDVAGLSLTGAVFDMQRPLQYRDGSNVWVSNGDERHRGLELQASGHVTQDLRVIAGMMFLDAKQRSTGDVAREGKRVPGVPDWTANVFADYRIHAVPGLFVNAGAYYSASQYFDVTNQQPIPSWTRFDVGARYETR
ncbi:MAG: TonB-dependent siderophore receptor, partial [Casimicrobiaceae bacterium]